MEITNVQFQVPVPGATDIYFHNEVNNDSCISFLKEFNNVSNELTDIENKTCNKLQQFFNIPNKYSPKFPINIHMNTPGGNVYDGLSMYSYIKAQTNNRPITITCSGLVASMGISLLLSVPLEYRKAYAHTTFMIHQVASLAFGKIADIEEHVEEAKRLHNMLFDIIANNTKITKEQLEKCYETKKDWYMTAEEALEAGLISQIL